MDLPGQVTSCGLEGTRSAHRDPSTSKVAIGAQNRAKIPNGIFLLAGFGNVGPHLSTVWSRQDVGRKAFTLLPRERIHFKATPPW